MIREAARDGCRLASACTELGISVRTYERWVAAGPEASADRRVSARRAAPAHKLSAEERAQVLALANSEEFASLPPSQIVPTLADRGVYVASESTFYRILRSASQQHHRGRARKPVARSISTHRATGPNELWSWDITWLPSSVKGQYFYWYMVLDVFSRKIVAHEVHEEESAQHAAHLMRRASLSEGRIGKPLVLHSDNGGAMKGATMLATLENLGVAASFSRPRVSNDNAYAESLFRTCKYRPDYPCKPFADVAAARAWMYQFVQWYNHTHKHSGLKFVTPAQRHNGQAEQLMKTRREVYAAARKLAPRRWTNRLRNWDLGEEVWLNPERTTLPRVKHCA